MTMPRLARLLGLAAGLVAAAGPGRAQQPAGPPSVGVVKVVPQSVTPSSEFVGRIQSVERVNLVARVTAFLDRRAFTEGAEVKKGDLLYRLEQGPFQADVQAKQAAIAQFNAQLQNASITLTRQKTLLSSPAGQQAAVDLALANQGALQAQILGAQAQLRQSQINLDYTEIRAPIDGKIGRTTVTIGNVVGPNTGVLATIVSQDPMYAVFPVPVRTALDLRQRYAGANGFDEAVVKVRLPNGRLYERSGKLDFVDNTVAGNTDTITMRGVLPNPAPAEGQAAGEATRELVDGELVTVVIEDSRPVQALAVPRAAVLTDQSGDYVYVVDGENKVVQQRIRLGQSTPLSAVVTDGLHEGETVVVDGIQRIRPGIVVAPLPVTPGSGSPSRS
ncbi:MAG TPA: efflux RND transporter periplasmic adaptor subunit [Candidatus Sulfotelmatobacter sp.]|nr:efflux RND transporter periplasmic adaptor subunit [Candidatus Sulfotelmatobacter sp.]